MFEVFVMMLAVSVMVFAVPVRMSAVMGAALMRHSIRSAGTLAAVVTVFSGLRSLAAGISLSAGAAWSA